MTEGVSTHHGACTPAVAKIFASSQLSRIATPASASETLRLISESLT